MNQLIADLQALDMLNDRLAHLLQKIMSRYTKAELLEAASALNVSGISLQACTSKWDLLKQILCDVSEDSWLLSPE